MTYCIEAFEVVVVRIGDGLVFSPVRCSSSGLRLLLVCSLKSTSRSFEKTAALRFPSVETILQAMTGLVRKEAPSWPKIVYRETGCAPSGRAAGQATKESLEFATF